MGVILRVQNLSIKLYSMNVMTKVFFTTIVLVIFTFEKMADDKRISHKRCHIGYCAFENAASWIQKLPNKEHYHKFCVKVIEPPCT